MTSLETPAADVLDLQAVEASSGQKMTSNSPVRAASSPAGDPGRTQLVALRNQDARITMPITGSSYEETLR